MTDARDHAPLGGEIQAVTAAGGEVEAVAAAGGEVQATIAEGGDLQAVASGWRLALREYADNRLAVFALIVLVLIVLFAFLGPVFYHTNQSLTDVLNANLAPGAKPIFGSGASHPLGTDEHGFDELGRIMLGGQSSLEIGFFAAAVAIGIGTVYGAVAGLIGGFLDGLMMRIVDVLLSIPFLLIVLVLATKYSGTITEISLIFGIFSWLVPARLVRGEVLSLRTRDFVMAAHAMGASRTRLICRHLIPNAMSVTIVNTTFLIADSILALAYLGALGFGLNYPHTSWGDMLGNAQTYINQGQWWLVWPVGGLLVVVVLAFNIVGDALRDAVDARLRRR